MNTWTVHHADGRSVIVDKRCAAAMEAQGFSASKPAVKPAPKPEPSPRPAAKVKAKTKIKSAPVVDDML